MIVYEILLLLLAFILFIYYLAKKYPKMRDTFAFVSIFVLILFTIWRIFFTVPNDTIISLVFGWIFLIA